MFSEFGNKSKSVSAAVSSQTVLRITALTTASVAAAVTDSNAMWLYEAYEMLEWNCHAVHCSAVCYGRPSNLSP